MTKKKSKPSKSRDPYYLQELKSYKQPIPSREFIIEVLTKLRRPASLTDIIQGLGTQSPSLHSAVGNRVRAMLRDQQLVLDKHGKYCLNPESLLVNARVHISRNQTVALIPDDESLRKQYIIVNNKQSQSLMHGDQVKARFCPNEDESKTIGVIVEISKRKQTHVVGRLRPLRKQWAIETMTPLVSGVIICDAPETKQLSGTFVKAKIEQYPEPYSACHVKIEAPLGELDSPTLGKDMMINSSQLPGEFNHHALDDADKINHKGIAVEENRVDLRDHQFITIDGHDARDFDDAIHVEADGDDWLLSVAISDVSHYIEVDSALDHAAYLRATSVYLPNAVLPMLPPVLSDGLCSLCPDVDRLVKVIKIRLSHTGDVKTYDLSKAVIRSKARLTYQDAQQIIHGNQEAATWLTELLRNAYRLYQLLDHKRQHRGALEIELPFTQLIFDEHEKIKSIKRGTRLESHKLIEEFMLLANQSVADYLLNHKQPALFRNHNKPDQLKLQRLGQFLSLAGVDATIAKTGDFPTKKLQQVIKACTATEHSEIYIPLVLSTLAQACYEPHNKGHYGLAFDKYCHFTSPIRRYPDLIVHRAIDCILDKGVRDRAITPKGISIAEAAKHCSSAERTADEAQKKATQWLKCYYMQDKVGQVYDATITGVKSFGMFAAIDAFFIDGLIHVSTLDSYYRYDEARYELVDDKSHRAYRIGQSIRVKVKRVEVLEQIIDLEIVR